jgi:hypothetical protein
MMTEEQNLATLQLAARILSKARDEFHESGDPDLEGEVITEEDLDRTIALMDALQALGEGIGQYGYIGNNRRERAPWFRDEMANRGILEVTERTISTFGAPDVTELAYTNKGKPRYAYIVSGWYEVDSPYEDSYVFAKPIPEDKIISVIRALNILL